MTICDRRWEVEAARDGRLPDRDLGRAIEHQSTCADCGAERAALEQLADDLRASRPSTDDLALRRVRNAVLARVSRPAAPPRASRRWVGAATAAAMATGIGLAGWATLRDPGGATSGPAGVVVDAQEGGLASHVESGREDRVLLSEGRFAIDVRQQAPGRRLVFALPDGELEDRGTRFEVNVRGGRTIGVVVHEGAVVLRRTGHEEVHLAAGAAWSPPANLPTGSGSGVPGSNTSEPTGAPPPPAVAPSTSTTPSAAPSAAPASAPARPRAGARAIGSGPVEGGSVQVQPREVPPGRDQAGQDQAAGRDPLREDGALEDEAYLHVVALLREGRGEEARIAARSYLRRFPQGLRRTEVAAIAR